MSVCHKHGRQCRWARPSPYFQGVYAQREIECKNNCIKMNKWIWAMRDASWFWSPEEGRKTSSCVREDVTGVMLFEQHCEGPLGSLD